MFCYENVLSYCLCVAPRTDDMRNSTLTNAHLISSMIPLSHSLPSHPTGPRPCIVELSPKAGDDEAPLLVSFYMPQFPSSLVPF